MAATAVLGDAGIHTGVTYGDHVTRSRRLATAAAALAAVAATSLPLNPATASPGFPPELAGFYTQALTWAPCADGLQCTWLTVPLDYADPAGTTIRLRVSRALATGAPAARQGSLVVNPGGPGASGVDFASYVATGIAPQVATQFDVVGFDPRGVGQSAPITCLTGPETNTWLRTDGSPDTLAEQRRLMSLAAGLAQGCLTRSPQIARHIGSDQTVRDMDILRQALGDERLNFLGYSYGTYLGTLYAERFPATVGRFVLDGALDPSLGIMQISQGQSDGFQVAMTRFARDCATRRTCPWAGSANSVLRGINDLLASIDRRPLPARDARDLVQAEALGALFYSMYSPLIWPSLRFALRQAVKGDGTGLQTIADFAADRTGPDEFGSNMASAFPAIACWDTPAAPGLVGLRAAANRWARGARVPEMARAMSWGNAPCSQWFGHSDRVPAPAATSTTAPILVVGTTFDPATPYAWAQALSRQLPTSTLLTFRGDGHTAYGAGSRCVDTAVDAYLLTGALPAAGTVCR
jgi:pimeloyl-ACP methyl ester carboxylesterase